MRSIIENQGVHQEVTTAGSVVDSRHIGEAHADIVHSGGAGIEVKSQATQGQAMSFQEALSSTLQENAELYRRLAQ